MRSSRCPRRVRMPYRPSNSDAPGAPGVEPLESRVLMSATIAAASLRAVAAPPAALTVASHPAAAAHQTSVSVQKAAATPSLADRQDLLNNWVGPGASTLAALLAANNTAGFDAQL